MKYRIKDPKVEKAVQGMFKDQSEFEFILNAVCVGQMGDTTNHLRFVVNSERSVTGGMVYVDIKKSDIETTDEYNPNGWNEMNVLPPANGQYLVYCKSEKLFSIWNRYEDHWRNGNWPIFYDNDGDEDLKYFKYRSLDFLKEEDEEND